MAMYMPPWLDRPPYYGPGHKASRLARLRGILTIAVAVGLVCLLAALVTAIVTAGTG
jgi:hypothetical protein